MTALSRRLQTLKTQTNPRIADKFSVAASRYDALADVQQRIAKDTMTRLQLDNSAVLLDIGCGTGRHTAQLAEQGAQVFGLDIAQGMVQYAQSHYPHLRFYQGDAAAMPFSDGSFTHLYSSMALQWCVSPLAAIKECYRVLAQSGKATFAIMLSGSFVELETARAIAGIGGKTNAMADLAGWRDAAEQAGFQIRDAQRLAYTHYYDSVLALLRSIARVGAGTSLTSDSTARKLTKRDLKRLQACYPQQPGQDKPFGLTYQVAHLSLEK